MAPAKVAKKIITAKNVGEFVQIFDRICKVLDKYKDQIYTFSKEIARKVSLCLHGRQIAIIGPVAAGKTTLLHVLQDPVIRVDPMVYAKTTDAATFADKIQIEWKLPLDDNRTSEVVRLKIKKPKDVGGEPALREDEGGWLDVCKGSDFIFYLFDASSVDVEGGGVARIRDDFEWIANHAQDFASGFKIVMFANKVDKLRGDGDRFEKFEQQHLIAIAQAAREALDPYQHHLVLATPCCLLSNKDRTNSISLALKYLAELM